jgi:hypothetical protein
MELRTVRTVAEQMARETGVCEIQSEPVWR